MTRDSKSNKMEWIWTELDSSLDIENFMIQAFNKQKNVTTICPTVEK